MNPDKFDYCKTVEKKKLYYEGIESEKRISKLYIVILNILGFYFGYEINQSILNDANSNLTDILMAYCLPILIITAFLLWGYDTFSRDKLKEIKLKNNKIESLQLLIDAANNLNWSQEVFDEKFIIFETNYGYWRDKQYITLIFSPDKRIYFSSINWNNYHKWSRFSFNYEELINEYEKLENNATCIASNCSSSND